MYYQETVINGRLYCKYTPDGEWHKVSADKLTDRLIKAQQKIIELQMKIEGFMSQTGEPLNCV